MTIESYIASAEADIARPAPQAYAEAIARLAASGTPYRPFGPGATAPPEPACIGLVRRGDEVGTLTGELRIGNRTVVFIGTRQPDGTYALAEADVAE